ncbi:HAD-IIB family hydrolase [Limosilactobacillus fastidiosus]|uniref:HAD family phosphatase n=1 Tax=Limosilactobacillus fastidiosus TaxID=2759855 RepID=A0A7W3TZY5_9LACO|nr:HAD-IIB family hydrolase [Limosilactobacillus fastidiosus]MBB1063552.1 HAD family phosphatase [Limosilactobacillus fastidiosus]MBB1086329.1 HAD family phosphatase [Limosilactobacillus fastidiosus]MCD7084016.1 Cof-type HAD-IIB family hydrolase [Limosilactobacillus fastidiosus]MCD7086434.1 Cof-type HAD-IIB family hydrolase [Limosilactobacillus fastidiosus]MCD7114210.1 Cof-type HAD-IIB family hydrolase [Limosilactobacillus fastidiosus]
MIPQKFIAIDIDGTLYDDHDHFDIQRFNQDYQVLLNKGILLIVATGNSYDAVKTIFEKYPVNTFIAENGGRIVINDKDVISHVHSHVILQKLMTFLAQKDYQPNLFSLSGASHTFIDSQFKAVPVPFYPHHQYFTSLDQVTEPVYNVNLNWFKHRPELVVIHQVINEINQAFPMKLQATYSGAYGIDILPYGVNKAAGLKELIHHFPNRTLKDVVAFGDTSNDLEMIQESGIGFAMKNATSDLKQVADQITSRDNNHDGLLYEIEKQFLI